MKQILTAMASALLMAISTAGYCEENGCVTLTRTAIQECEGNRVCIEKQREIGLECLSQSYAVEQNQPQQAQPRPYAEPIQGNVIFLRGSRDH